MGLGEVGAMVEMLLGLAFVFLGIALLVKGWRSERARRLMGMPERYYRLNKGHRTVSQEAVSHSHGG